LAAEKAEIGRPIFSRVRRASSPIVRLWRAAAFFLLLAVAAVSSAASPAAAQAADSGASAAQPASQTPAKIPSALCLSCHGTEGFAVEGSDGKPRSLFVDQEKFRPSIHGGRECVDCHTNITSIPHSSTQVRVDCVSCHENLWDKAQIEGKTDEFATLGFVVGRIDAFMNSIHARPSLADQSQTNATCYDCHDAHDVYPPGTPRWQEWRLNLPNACGKCHAKELAAYAPSVHGQLVLEDHDPAAATCADCHTTHDIQNPALNATKLVITRNCGSCHKEEFKSYLDTYHGQVTELGYAYTAKCFDCHGNHAIQRVDDHRSTVFPTNRLATCQKCHTNASAGFVTFEPHATTHNLARYPYTWLASKFMILLLGGTFAFFWTHSALWFYRELRDHRSGANRPHIQTDELLQGATVYYRRWPAMWRIAHLAFAITVICLVFTGMTLFYADSFWAPAVQHAFGGPRVTGTIHRVFAVTFLSIFFAHLAYVMTRIVKNHRTFRWFGRTSLVPNLQDIRDAFSMFKWFFGMGAKPLFDKWTYWEKFDYWAPFWGVTIIGVSGAMLWFKTVTATILPGWVFNVATIFHGEEAFLAAGFLFTVHFFNNHWRPENFPLDILMFTGAVPLEKFRREHTLEYNRLVASGELKKYIVEAPSRPMRLGSQILGFTLMAAGLILLILILSGFVRGMTG
jgi:cytochrome b subunit of formate dehydrogenase/cytochrome c553